MRPRQRERCRLLRRTARIGMHLPSRGAGWRRVSPCKPRPRPGRAPPAPPAHRQPRAQPWTCRCRCLLPALRPLLRSPADPPPKRVTGNLRLFRDGPGTSQDPLSAADPPIPPTVAMGITGSRLCRRPRKLPRKKDPPWVNWAPGSGRRPERGCFRRRFPVHGKSRFTGEQMTSRR